MCVAEPPDKDLVAGLGTQKTRIGLTFRSPLDLASRHAPAHSWRMIAAPVQGGYRAEAGRRNCFSFAPASFCANCTERCQTWARRKSGRDRRLSDFRKVKA